MRLNFYQLGEPNSKPVILIHGLFGSLSNLSGLGRALVQLRNVYQVDLRNHGASAHSDQMDFDCMAADIIELMDSQGLETAAVVGHSLGGKVAMQTALSYPDRISRLVIADIAPVRYPPQHDAVFAGLSALDNLVIKQRSSATSILEKYVTEPNVRAFVLKNLVRTNAGEYKLRINYKSIMANYHRLIEPLEGAPYTKPVLFIKGSLSDHITQAHQDQVLTLFPRASLKIIEGAGHWLHTDKPAVFNRLVIGFLQDE